MLLAVVIAAVTVVAQAQVSPTWTRNNYIDAGESKPINFDVAPANSKAPGTTYNYNQHFNKTDFGVAPRVRLGQLCFAFPVTSGNNQSSMGYNITMGSINPLNFTFEVSTRGVTIYGLHFIYFAVSPIYDGIYLMDNIYTQCTQNFSQLRQAMRSETQPRGASVPRQ
jgi:hypothetical protein